MSLINDALRRADMEQRARDAGGTPPSPPPLPPKEEGPPAAPQRRSHWKLVLGAVVLIGAGGVALGAWWGIGAIREKAGAAVETASAAFHEALGGSGKPEKGAWPTEGPTVALVGATNDGAAGAAGAEARTPAEPPTDADAPPAAETPPETDPASAPAEGTPNAPAPDTAAETEPVRLADTSDASDAAGTAEDAEPTETSPDPAAGDVHDDSVKMAEVFGRMLSMFRVAARPPVTRQQAPASTAGSNGATASAGSAAAAESAPKPERTATESAPQPAPPAPSVLLPPADTSHLKISSIMNGSGGALAIINGRPVREGETVAGAKVLRIDNRTVEVEIDGRRATVGL